MIGGAPTFNESVYTWGVSDGLRMEIGFLIDNLSALMMTVVTFVSLAVHVYTIGYMRDDPGYTRFFAYISLFTFAMLMLVMSNNFLQLFFGWEAVGLVSYLLIGFWFKRPTAIFANYKAFIVNRIGDFAFIVAIAIIVAYMGSLDYVEVFERIPRAIGHDLFLTPGEPSKVITVICVGLFIGAMGKSAQVPLHVWLPDSMEGPTPISALIHAATMVTAGIFMVARMSPLFQMSPDALHFIIVIGATTALFMGLLGLVNNDIKRVIAYSTLSQLGYMTAALGAGAYGAGIFHLMTHAFFKALLFLAAGSVIIGMHHEQDMRRMGGLKKYMPVTYWTCLIGCAGADRLSGVLGILLQGHHHRGAAPQRDRGRELRLLVRAHRRVRDRALQLPPGVHDLPRSRAHGRAHARAPAREPLGGDAAAGRARDTVDRNRLDDGRPGRVRRLLCRRRSRSRRTGRWQSSAPSSTARPRSSCTLSARRQSSSRWAGWPLPGFSTCAARTCPACLLRASPARTGCW